MLALAAGLPLFFVLAQESAPPAPELGNINVQITTFQVTGPGFALSLLNEPVSGDEALFNRLAGMVADGSAELLADHHFTAPAGKNASAESIRQFPFPTEYTPQRGATELVPQAFDFKYTGVSAKAELHLSNKDNPSGPARSVRGTISVESIRADELDSWPVSLPKSPADGSLVVPKFLTDKTWTSIQSRDNDHHLVSVLRRAGETAEDNNKFVLSFVETSPEAATATAPGANNALRLHALTFRLPVKAGRDAMRSDGPDSASRLLDTLLNARADGKVEMIDCTFLRFDPLSPAETGAESRPPATDPFASSNATQASAPMDPFASPPPPHASADAIREFAYPTAYSDDLLPQSFDYRNLGRSFAARSPTRKPSGEVVLNLTLQHNFAPELFAWPENKSGRSPQVSQPAFSSTELTVTVAVRPGGVYCLGAVTLPSSFKDQSVDQPMMDIYLLKVTGNNTGAALSGTRQPEIEGEILSLTPADAVSLQALAGSSVEAETPIAESLSSGSARSLGFCQVAGGTGDQSSITVNRQTPAPNGCERTQAGWLRPTEFEYHNEGIILQEVTTAPEKSEWRFFHSGAQIIQPGEAELSEAADGNGRLTQPRDFWSQGHPISTAGPGFHLLSIEPAKGPPGHPEEGRMHAMVLRIRE